MNIWTYALDAAGSVVSKAPLIASTFRDSDPDYSPDGRRIVFDTRANNPAKAGSPSVWVVEAEGGPARRLTEAATGDVAPSWSRDGGRIYFASTRSGNLQIWKMPAQSGPAVQVTRKGGFEGFESADGQHLLYVKGREVPGIWSVPAGGGDEVPLTDRDQIGYWRCWRVAESGLPLPRLRPVRGCSLWISPRRP